jgi:hypothetical protein
VGPFALPVLELLLLEVLLPPLLAHTLEGSSPCGHQPPPALLLGAGVGVGRGLGGEGGG